MVAILKEADAGLVELLTGKQDVDLRANCPTQRG